MQTLFIFRMHTINVTSEVWANARIHVSVCARHRMQTRFKFYTISSCSIVFLCSRAVSFRCSVTFSAKHKTHKTKNDKQQPNMHEQSEQMENCAKKRKTQGIGTNPMCVFFHNSAENVCRTHRHHRIACVLWYVFIWHYSKWDPCFALWFSFFDTSFSSTTFLPHSKDISETVYEYGRFHE